MTAADLVLLNGRIWTGTGQTVSALATSGGRVLATGTDDSIRQLVTPSTRVIDLQGKLALPGFIDDHTHFIHGGEHLLSVDLRRATSRGELAQQLHDHATTMTKDEWIRGGSWDHELWGGVLPTRQDIDGAADQPVWVTRLDKHMGLANSKALALAGITRDTQDPAGGVIVRDAAGEPTGVLKDAAMKLIDPAIPRQTAAEQDAALTAAMAEAARVGVTSVQDISSWSDVETYQRFRQQRRLRVRVSARTPVSSWERQADLVDADGPGDGWFRFSGLKAFMDGSLGSTTALFFQPYCDEPSTAGLMVADNQPEGVLRDAIVAADRRGMQCSIHAIGDRANSLLLDYFEHAIATNGPRDRRFRIEHAQHLRQQDVPRFAAMGVIASAQPAHAIDDGRWADGRLGPDRIATAYPFRSLLDSGATVVFGSDWTVAPLSPLLGVQAAVTRATTDGRFPDGWVPEQKITVEEAIRAYTSACAFADFAEDEKGTLTPGRLADVAVLSQDIFTIPSAELAQTEVLLTIVDGNVVHEA